MIVVADTSVILNLCRVQQERLLQQLYRRVLIPSRVALEFQNLAGTRQPFGQAQQLGLRVIGILGVLVQSHQQGLLLKVGKVLDQLEKEVNFWKSPQLRAKVLHSVGE